MTPTTPATTGSGEDFGAGPRLALFGGSFDPVHLGHLGMARAAREALALDQVIFVPCWRSPFKAESATGAEHRAAMLRLALREAFGEAPEAAPATPSAEASPYALSTWEIERPAASYSWETAQHYRALRPEARWHWILGADQWEALPRWSEPDRLRRELIFVVAHRAGHVPEPRPGWEVVFLPYDHPASSSAIRADFAAKQSWVPRSVAAYCECNGLYGSLGSSR